MLAAADHYVKEVGRNGLNWIKKGGGEGGAGNHDGSSLN